MTSNYEAADDKRSGTTIDEAVAQAEEGSEVEKVHQAPDPGDEGTARREEIRRSGPATAGGFANDEAAPVDLGPGLSPTETGSGGAQNIVGARISDRVAAGQPVPDEAPFVPPKPAGPDPDRTPK